MIHHLGHIFQKSYFLRLTVLLALLTVVTAGNFYLHRLSESLPSVLSSSSGTVLLQTLQQTIPPETVVTLHAVTTSGLAFAHSEVIFDPALVRLAAEPVIVGPLGNINQVTSMQVANTTGRVIVTLGLDPSLRSSPPTGTIPLLYLKFGPVPGASGSVLISIDHPRTQLVDINASPISTTALNQVLIIDNSLPTSTPTLPPPTPTSIAATFPTATATRTPTSTLTPTRTPTRALVTKSLLPTSTPVPPTITSAPVTPVPVTCGTGVCRGYYSSAESACSVSCSGNKTCSPSAVSCGGLTCYRRLCIK